MLIYTLNYDRIALSCAVQIHRLTELTYLEWTDAEKGGTQEKKPFMFDPRI